MDLVYVKRGMGLFSIGLGVMAAAAPQRLSRWLGLDAEPEAISAFGAREIANGAGLLSPVKPGPWFWLRVGGDVMDMAALAKALGRDNPRRRVAAAVLAAVAAAALIDLALAAHATLNPRENRKAAA